MTRSRPSRPGVRRRRPASHLGLAALAAAALASSLLLAAADTVRAVYDKDFDWKDRKHTLRVCLKTGKCPPGMAESLKTAIDIWNSYNLTWRFVWDSTACDSADIVVQCKRFINGAAVTNARFNSNQNTSATITVDSTEEWGYCNNRHEIVSTLLHELGHCARLEETPASNQNRIMRWRQDRPGHLRSLSREDSLEAATSDTATAVTVNTKPKGGKRQEFYQGVITAAEGTPPLALDRALFARLEAYQPQELAIQGYGPIGAESLGWGAVPLAEPPAVQLFCLQIVYPESTVVREGALHVADAAWDAGWAPSAVAPNDTVVPTDASEIVLDATGSTHPAGPIENAAWAEWIVDDTTAFKGEPVTSVTLPQGAHLVRLRLTDHFGNEDEDTMAVVVLQATGVEEGAAPAERAAEGRGALDLRVPTPFRLGGTLPIAFTLPGEAEVTLAVYDVGGRRVRAILDGVRLPGGVVERGWDLRDARGRPVAPGAYVCVLRAGAAVATQRIVLSP